MRGESAPMMALIRGVGLASFRVVHVFAYNLSAGRLRSREVAVARHAEFDEIGYWSEVKLEIIKKYAAAYSTILAAIRSPSWRMAQF